MALLHVDLCGNDTHSLDNGLVSNVKVADFLVEL